MDKVVMAKTIRTEMQKTLDRMKKTVAIKHTNHEQLVQSLASLWADYTNLFFFLSVVTLIGTGIPVEKSLEILIKGIKMREEKIK